jgi:type I restriction enzyme S subunit
LTDSGTLLITIAANIAETAILTIPACFPDSIVGFIADPVKTDVKFIKYQIDYIKRQMQNIAPGAAQDNLSLDKLLTFDFLVPHPSIQAKIVAVISSYDDLIENNQRRIKLLEQAAHDLYQEWFVHFRFPGHEQVEMVNVDSRILPAGWEISSLGKECQIVMGQSPKSEFYNEQGVGLPFHQGVSYFGDWFPTHTIYCSVENRIAEEGDVLFSVRAPVGRMNLADTRLIVGRGLAAIRCKPRHREFIFEQLKVIFYEEDLIGGGTIFQSVTKDDVHKIGLVKPSQNLIEQFGNLVGTIYEQIYNLFKRNELLRNTRNLLLPRLISGELDVSNLDIPVSEELAVADDGA